MTGAESGVFVLDVDVKGGVDGYAQLEALGELPETLTVRTSSGGAHFYFRHPGFVVRNRKPASAIDLKGDKDRDDGLVYVVGPGSPGYVKTDDPEVVVQGDAYELVQDAPIADAPDWLIAWLQIVDERGGSFAPTPIDVSSAEGARRLRLGEEAAKTFRPSRGDGEGGKRLLAICLRLVRGLELPLPEALALIETHFNPRCTQPDGVTPWPWETDDIVHKLIDARDRSDSAVGILSEATEQGINALKARMSTPPALRDGVVEPPAAKRRVKSATHAYTHVVGEMASHANAQKLSFNSLIEVFARGPHWAGCWQYDEFAEQLICIDPPIRLDAETTGLSPTDVSIIRAWLDHEGVLANDKDIYAAIWAAARRLSFHPVREYLEALPPGDPKVFDGLAKKLFGTDEPLADEFLRKFLVSSVRRILAPGTQVDTVLVLHGAKQGEGKTTFVEALFEDRWTRRGLPADLANRDASHALLGYRCIELGELASLLRTEKNAAKDFITWREDVYRQYGNGERVRRPRQCVFIGTTNDDDFLRDATGNRRFWIVVVEDGHSIPVAWVREHRNELWAAALSLAKDASYRHWFTANEEPKVNKTREGFLEVDAWHEQIVEHCKGRETVKAVDVFTSAIGGDVKDFDRRKLLRVVDTLKRIGCRTVVRKDAEGFSVKFWKVPTELLGQKPSPQELAKRIAEDNRARMKRN